MEEISKEADAVWAAGSVLRRAQHRREEGFSLLISSLAAYRSNATRAMAKLANGAAGFAKLDSELKKAYQWVNQAWYQSFEAYCI
jgi:hypothetical protein